MSDKGRFNVLLGMGVAASVAIWLAFVGMIGYALYLAVVWLSHHV